MGLQQVYTGSKDETVRVWDVATGKCTSVVQVGGHVDSLLMESGYLFVGMHITNTPDQPGLIKVRLSHGTSLGMATWSAPAWKIASASSMQHTWRPMRRRKALAMAAVQQYWQVAADKAELHEAPQYLEAICELLALRSVAASQAILRTQEDGMVMRWR